MPDHLDEQLEEMQTYPRVVKAVFSVRSSAASVLLHPWAAVVEQAKTRLAVPISHSADRDSGLLEHLVQCGFLNGCWRDALLVCQELQLPVRKTEKGLSI